MKKICFFSSDARPLYKQDVFRAMSYPKGYVIHFRYQEIHVTGDPLTLEGKEGVIFFTTGNDLNMQEANRNLIHTSIREVTIQEVQKTEDTGQCHFYLCLGDFKTYSISNNPIEIMPLKKLVTELEISGGSITKWHQVIDTIKVNFPNQLFYKFQVINKKKNVNLVPHYDKIEKQSFYNLSDESSYVLDMAFYDTEPNESNYYHKLKITAVDSDNIKIVVPETIDIDTRRDNRQYSIFTKTLSSSNTYTYISFETLSSHSASSQVVNIDTTLKIEIKKNISRSIWFGIYTLIAAISVGYGKILADNISLNGSFSLSLTVQIFICSLLGFFAAFKLYLLVNKN